MRRGRQASFGLLPIILLLRFSAAAEPRAQAEFSLPAPASTAPTVNLWATYYVLYPATAVAKGLPLRDKQGAPITGNLSPHDWCLGAIEGSIQVTDESGRKTFNYAGTSSSLQVDCALTLKINASEKPWISAIGKSYFTRARGPYGDGVADFILVPFRTIAVDSTAIPYGTAIFVPEARGVTVTLPNGEAIVHDGYFFAGDKGSAIKGAHIDVFCGTSRSNCFPSFVRSSADHPFKAWVVSDPDIRAKLEAMHHPP